MAILIGLVSSGAVASTFTNNTSISVGNTNFDGQDYLLSSPDGIVTELQRTTNSTIPDGATVLVDYESLLETVPAGLNLTIASFVEVDAGGAINADGIGYATGPGVGLGIGPASGGGYGGNGGSSGNFLAGGSQYGSYFQPINLGSGGGGGYSSPGGAGGGLIHIAASGGVTVNGLISANGANGTNSLTGGGSGGSIWIIGQSLSGSGMVT
ncbi:MAG TPA: hypothetical protein VN281_07545, partial [Verrucomicrobiae bacterium]|nr:hypothetical protein [Verrucomicrobiae bacterium]